MRFSLLLPTILLFACPTGTPPDDDDSPADDDDSGGDDDTAGDDDTTGQLPETPFPFGLTIAGAENQTLSFTSATCTHYGGSSDFRVRMITDDSWLMTMQVVGQYVGAGGYDAATGARASLQQNVAQAPVYDTQTGGSTVTFTIAYEDADIAYGVVEVSTLTSAQTGAITLSPTEIPIWCSDVVN
jgi:hypothetical protein